MTGITRWARCTRPRPPVPDNRAHVLGTRSSRIALGPRNADHLPLPSSMTFRYSGRFHPWSIYTRRCVIRGLYGTFPSPPPSFLRPSPQRILLHLYFRAFPLRSLTTDFTRTYITHPPVVCTIASPGYHTMDIQSHKELYQVTKREYTHSP